MTIHHKVTQGLYRGIQTRPQAVSAHLHHHFSHLSSNPRLLEAPRAANALDVRVGNLLVVAGQSYRQVIQDVRAEINDGGAEAAAAIGGAVLMPSPAVKNMIAVGRALCTTQCDPATLLKRHAAIVAMKRAFEERISRSLLVESFFTYALKPDDPYHCELDRWARGYTDLRVPVSALYTGHGAVKSSMNVWDDRSMRSALAIAVTTALENDEVQQMGMQVAQRAVLSAADHFAIHMGAYRRVAGQQQFASVNNHRLTRAYQKRNRAEAAMINGIAAGRSLRAGFREVLRLAEIGAHERSRDFLSALYAEHAMDIQLRSESKRFGRFRARGPFADPRYESLVGRHRNPDMIDPWTATLLYHD